MLHVTWTEWKNLFSLEIYCRTAKLQVDGLVRSYGPQTLRIYRMGPELGPPRGRGDRLRTARTSPGSASGSTSPRPSTRAMAARSSGDLDDARYAWTQVEAAYADSEYATMREGVDL